MVIKPMPVNTIIHRLRLMGESGGMITKDRKRVIIEAADLLEELDERVAIMEEGNKLTGGDGT